MTVALSENQYSSEIKELLINLFESEKPDLFSFPFNKKFEKSLILFEYLLNPNQDLLYAISKAVKPFGDNGFYITYPEPHPINSEIPYHWFIRFEDIGNYEKIVPIDKLDYIFLSQKGLWSIIPSGELFSVFSSTNAIVSAVIQDIPEIDTLGLRFLKYFQEVKQRHPSRVDVSWVEPLIKNVYDERTTRNLLK